MSAADTPRARQAALLLHGLPSAVRQQVIARLGATESARLAPLLKDLAELGIPPSLGESLQGFKESNDARLPAPQRVERMSAEEVASRLHILSPVMVAKLLRSREWPWEQRVLDRLSDIRRAEVQYLRRDTPGLAPAVLTALCERLCAQTPLPHVGRTDAGAAASNSFKRFIRWIR